MPCPLWHTDSKKRSLEERPSFRSDPYPSILVGDLDTGEMETNEPEERTL